jgi:catechol 2,3-dioxygenase-like lactoylglutathione lyase family enzyme
MTIELNHTIVPVTDKRASSEFLCGILRLEPARPWGVFMGLRVANGVTLDFEDVDAVEPHHYAFLVSDSDFDAILERIQRSGAGYYADYTRQPPGEVNHHYGGRGVYFDDPDGHLMEAITTPYGDVPEY